MHVVNTYKEFAAKNPATNGLRTMIRKVMIGGLSLPRQIDAETDWIRFPYYHHVFDDEKAGFERQLRYLSNFGDYISLDEACKMISDSKSLKGRYFCVSFDDGFYNCFSNMTGITSTLNIPVMIYLPTDYIGLNPEKEEDQIKIENFYPECPRLVPFLTWEQCKSMMNHKVFFGSHTCSHANLSRISIEDMEKELVQSKNIIESRLNVPCHHFACPWGRPGIDFFPDKTTGLAKRAGYQSFATTSRGKMKAGDDLFILKRDHLLAGWENFQLKYFFSL